MLAQIYVFFAFAIVNHGLISSANQVRSGQSALVVQRVMVSYLSSKDASGQIKAAALPGVKSVVYDPTDESFIAQGTEKGLQLVRDLLAKIDKPVLAVRKFAIANADARALVDKIQKPFDGVELIVFDPTDNSVIAKGTGKGLERLHHVIIGLDKK